MTWDGLTVLYAAARWLSYLAAFLVIGAVAFRVAVLPRAAADEPEALVSLIGRTARLAFLAAASLFLVHCVRLYLQARSLTDPSEPVTVEFVGAILDTSWGHGWIAQTAAALASALGAFAHARSLKRGHLLSIGALGVILAAPLTGHAVALPQAGRLGYPADLLHFGLGAIWLGTLTVMLFVGLTGPLAGKVTARRLVVAFSPLALWSGVPAIGLGLFIAWRYLGGLEPLVSSIYGRTVLIKLLALGGVAAVGGYNWRVVQPKLNRGFISPIVRTAALEVMLALVLVAITAVLVALPLPGEE